MRNNIKQCVLEEANYILKTKLTIRDISKIFNVSKSTIHKDLTERLKHINIDKYNEVMSLMKEHIEIRHINGGNATKHKYLKNKIIAKCNAT